MKSKVIKLTIFSVLFCLAGTITGCTTGNKTSYRDSYQTIEPGEYSPNVDYTKSLKILCIGNSFSDNAIAYMYPIAKAFGIEEVKIANLYIGGCSLETHANNAFSNSASYTYRVVNADTNGVIQTAPTNVRMIDGIVDEDWDIITMQQVSGKSGVPSTYNEHLVGLNGYVKDNATNPKTQFGWHMTWAYQQNSTHTDFRTYNRDQLGMYYSIRKTTQDCIENTDMFDFVVPAGTAIQNARTSYLGDNLTQDGYHLNDKGEYIIGLTWIMKITGLTRENFDESKAPYAFQHELDTFFEAAENAIKDPYKITNSKILEAPAMPEVDLSKYTVLDWNPVIGYWNSNDGSNYNKLITTAGNSTTYMSTETPYTRDDLPVGSIIELQEGWAYRPEAWVDFNTRQTTRPDVCQESRVFIDDTWWANYQYRAFNVYKIGTNNLTGQEEAVKAAFKIYIPK